MKQYVMDERLRLAVLLHNQGQFNKAEELYRSVLAADNKDFYALRFLGCLLRLTGRFDEAIILLEQACLIRPQDADVYFNYANVLDDSGRLREAIVAYKKSIQLRPGFTESQYNLALSLHHNGSLDEAIKQFNEILEVDPNDFKSYFSLGNSLCDMGEVLEAISCYKKAIQIKPDFADAYLNLGNALNEKGEVLEANSCYKKAIQIKPDFADAYLNLGNSLNAQGEAKKASVAYSSYYHLKPILRTSSLSITDSPGSNKISVKTKILCPDSVEFIPSYCSEQIPFGMHLMYIHIPKTAGMRFGNPISDCIALVFSQNLSKECDELLAGIYPTEEFSVMASRRIDSVPLREGILNSLESYSLRRLGFSFLMPHGIASDELSSATNKMFGVSPIRLATWREPEQRLRSALNYLWRTTEGDLDLIRRKIYANDPFLDNAIYRACYSSFGCLNQHETYHESKLKIDHLIDISDFAIINKIMSGYLSSCRLPNIIVNKSMNVTSVDKLMQPSLIDELMSDCLEKGFLQHDNCQEVTNLVSHELPSDFAWQFDKSIASLHPLTFISSSKTDVSTTGQSLLLPTASLMTEKGQVLLDSIFSNSTNSLKTSHKLPSIA